MRFGKIPALKTVAKRLFRSNRQANDDDKVSVAKATRAFPRVRFLRRRASTVIDTPVPSTPPPPAGSPAAAAAALNLPYPLPAPAAPVDLSPLATGMQLAVNPDEFVIRAYPGNHQACTPHPATGTMLVRPFSAPASTSPRFEVLALGSGISRREITMNDVRDELEKIFAQLPASKASPTKAAAAGRGNDNKISVDVNHCNAPSAATLSKSAVKKALMMSPSSDACIQTDFSDADNVNVTSDAAPASAVDVDDGKLLYAWGNSGNTMRLTPAAAAKLGMRCVVSASVTSPAPAAKQPAAVNLAPVSAAVGSDNEKVTVAWGNGGHTMRLSKTAAAKFGMRVIVPEVAFTPEPAVKTAATPLFTPVSAAAVKTPLSAAFTVGPLFGAPTPACSPADSLVSPPLYNTPNSAVTTTSITNKRPPPIRTSTFDIAAVMLKLANSGVTPPPTTTPTGGIGKDFADMTIRELASTPLWELYPQMYGPGDVLLSPFNKYVSQD